MSEPTRPRSEPEILPPERPSRNGTGQAGAGRFGSNDPRLWATLDGQDGGRIFIAKPGSFGTLLTVVAIGAVLGMALLALLGAFLFTLPVVGAIVAALILSTVIRRTFRSLR